MTLVPGRTRRRRQSRLAETETRRQGDNLFPGQSYLTLLSVIYNFCNNFVFAHAKPFQPSLMFAGKAGANPSEAPFRSAPDLSI
jgi:hypothetical protein